MAYNISVAIPNTQCPERWRWVRNGYELLRDRGIPLNPKDISLYRSLAWIFWHKIGDNLDDCHRYYKMQLLLEMRPLLGDKSNQEFDRLAAAPKDLSEILLDPEVAEIVEALRKADPKFTENASLEANFLSLRQQPSLFSRAAFDVIDAFRGKPGLDKLDVFVRAWILRNTWKMEPSEWFASIINTGRRPGMIPTSGRRLTGSIRQAIQCTGRLWGLKRPPGRSNTALTKKIQTELYSTVSSSCIEAAT